MKTLLRLIRWVRIFVAIRRIRKATSAQTEKTAKQTLSKLMAANRGISMKVGQVMAGMEDSNDFVNLTSSIEPWPLKHIIPLLESHWQTSIDTHLIHIEESQAAASLGQVHLAQLQDKQYVAIKVQYPDIAKAMHSEISMINLMPSVGPVKKWGFDLDAYKNNLHENMQRELNYDIEMQHQITFASKCQVEGLHIPKVYPLLSGKNILVQERVEGVRLQATTSWSLMERLQLGRTLMSTLFQSLFSTGLVHGDPHPGNLLYQRTKSQPIVHLLDYGCVIKVKQERRLALLKLILSLRGECQQSILDAFVALGFNEKKLICIQSQLSPLAFVLFQPFLEKKACQLQDWHPAQEIESVLGEQKWWFRAAGPADLFLLMRAFQGLIQQLKTLNVQLPWWPLLTQSLPKEMISQAAYLDIPTVAHNLENETYENVRYLKVKIEKEGAEKQHFSFDAIAALHLEILIPEHVATELKKTHIDIVSISTKLRQQGLEKKILFDLTIKNNHYCAWVE
ncbi:MAG: AarF/UbiB family protein [Mariprofundaceae bacterium]|nr:AarF/UbiB family protein [Mariprofundaceae bacterium]